MIHPEIHHKRAIMEAEVEKVVERHSNFDELFIGGEANNGSEELEIGHIIRETWAKLSLDGYNINRNGINVSGNKIWSCTTCNKAIKQEDIEKYDFDISLYDY